MRFRIRTPALLLWLIVGNLSAQVKDSSSALFSIGAHLHRSYIIQHTKKLSNKVTASHPWMAEVDLNWHLRERDSWEYCQCYPRTGISILYTDFDFPEVLGRAISAAVFIEPFIQPHRKVNFSIRFGLGPSYLTRVYDAETNPDNLFFSSPISFLVLLNASMNYRFTPRLTLRLTGSYNHISNGGYSEPNLGMNFPSFSVGMDYSFRAVELPRRNPMVTGKLREQKQRIDVVAAISAKPTSSGLHEKRYPVYVLGVNYSRAVARILALNGGLEWVNDRSLRQVLREKDTVNKDGRYPDHNRAGLLVGIDWLFGRFIFCQHLGIYVYSPVKAMSPVYQRYGLNYSICRHVFVGLNIKAHGQDADFMDVRVGYSF